MGSRLGGDFGVRWGMHRSREIRLRVPVWETNVLRLVASYRSVDDNLGKDVFSRILRDVVEQYFIMKMRASYHT